MSQFSALVNAAPAELIAQRLVLERKAGAVDPRIGHAQRLEEILPQEIAVGLAGDFLNDAAQQEVAGVVIVPFLSRVEIVGIVLKRFDEVIGLDWAK